MKSDGEYRDTQYSRMLLALGIFIVFGIGVAVGAVYGSASRVSLWGLGLVGVFALLRQSRLQVIVAEDGIHASKAFLPWQYVGRIEVLEGEAMRTAMTTGGHPNDFMQMRSTRAGVRVWLADPADPHRAWLLSVRDPKALQHVLERMERMGLPHA
jgi:hypothetical protein